MKIKLAKGIYALALLSTSGFLYSCMGVDNPDVAEGNVYVESNDEGNSESETPEQTGLTINGDWIEVQGTFSSGDDKDFYEIAVDQSIYVDDTTNYKVDFVAISEGEPLNLIMRAFYPANIVTYNQDGGANNILLIGATPISLRKGDEKIRVYAYGKKTEGNNKSIFADGKSYGLKFK